jgi:hypothetical protein
MASRTSFGMTLALAATMAVLFVAAVGGSAWAQTPATVNAGSPLGTISPNTPMLSVPVTIASDGTTPVMGFSVTLTVSGDMSVQGGSSGFVKGDFLGLGGNSNTSLFAINKGAGVWQLDGTTNGTPCGVTATSGTLFTINVGSSAASGPGTVTINSVKLRDCSNSIVTVSNGTVGSVQIDNNDYTLMLNQTGSGTMAKTPDLLTYHYGDVVTLTATAATGWTFTGWDAGVIDGKVTIQGNTTATATFTINTYTLTTSVTGSGSLSPPGGTYDYGTVVTVMALPVSGWGVVAWGGDASGHASSVTVTMDADKNVTAALGPVKNENTGLYYTAIQAAIDDTLTLGTHVIQAAAGTYEEQVVVTKALTLTGAGCGNTIIMSPATLTQSFMTGTNVNKPVVFVNGVNATIQNLTIDGAGLGNSNYRFVGLAFWNGGGKGANLCIQHIEDTPFSGAQHGVGVYAYNNTGGPYSLELDQVTVTDFQKTGIALLGNGLTVNVHDCTTTGKGYTGVTAQNGIQLSDGATGSITACHVSDIGYTGAGWAASGILTPEASGTVAVSGCTIDNVMYPIYWQNSSGTIDGVTVTNSARTGWQTAILAYNTNTSLLASRAGAPAPTPEPLKSSPFDEGAGVNNATAGTLATSYTLNVTNSCLTGTGAAGTIGIRSYSSGGGLDVTATNNTVQGWDYGLFCGTLPATLTAHQNSITSSLSAGFYGTGASDATRNWWGAASGPSGDGLGSGDSVFAASFSPWIHSGTDLAIGCAFTPPTYTIGASAGAGGGISPSGSLTAYEGDDVTYSITPNPSFHILDVTVDGVPQGAIATYTFTNVTVDHAIAATFVAAPVTNVNTSRTYVTIQAAIDDTLTLDTHVIQAAAGTYEEQVVVTKALTLTGAGCGNTIIKSPTTLTQSFMTGTNVNKPVVFVNGVNATIQNLTIDGAGLGNSNYRFIGLAFWNGGGKGANLCIKHIEDTPFSGAQHGVGVYAYNITGGPYSLELDQVTVTDFQKNGMALSGEGLTVNVHDCTTTGSGSTAATAQNGIQVGYGAGGTVSNCKISEIGFTGSGWSATGLLANQCGSPLVVSGLNGANALTNVQVPINWYDTNGSMNGIGVSGGADWGPIFVYNSNVSLNAVGGDNSTAKSQLGSSRRPVASPMGEADGNTSRSADKSSLDANNATNATSFAVSVTNSCLTGTNVAGTAGIGAYTEGGGLEVTATNNVVAGWDVGFTNYGSAAILTANFNSVSGNTTAGYDNTLSSTAQNAENNWWGAADGPSGVGSGAGDAVLGTGVDFTPWLGSNVNGTTGCGFTAVIRTITASAGVNGTITPSGSVTVYDGGNLTFTIAPNAGFHVLDVTVDGVSRGAIATYTFSNVTVDHTIAATFEVNPDVTAITDLTATRSGTGNPASSTTTIGLNWTATPSGTTVEVWRKGFGHYPEFDDAGGVAPTAPAAYADLPGAGWVKTTVTAPGGEDLVGERDYYSYVACVTDGYGTRSPVSNMGSALNYLLGDVSNGGTPGTGNNKVSTEDISLLGSHYGATLAVADDPLGYLDVGPTSNSWVDGLPVTDNVIEFEDLVMFALSFVPPGPAPQLNARPLAGGASGHDAVMIERPELVTMGAPVTVSLRLKGSGTLLALSTKLAWDPAVVEPVGHAAGEWLTNQGGVAFSAKPGMVDVAVMRGLGMSGEGTLATVTFKVLSAGDPKIRIVAVDGRTAGNEKVAVNQTERLSAPKVPTVTQLAFAQPNPFRGSAALAFSLAQGGSVELAIYSVDGRRVRTLVSGAREAGEYRQVWDGRDDQGQQTGAGVYYARLVAGKVRMTRTVVYLR